MSGEGPAAPAPAAPSGAWTRQMMQLALEIAHGLRPPAQLSRWVAGDVYEQLRRRGDLARRLPPTQRSPAQNPPAQNSPGQNSPARRSPTSTTRGGSGAVPRQRGTGLDGPAGPAGSLGATGPAGPGQRGTGRPAVPGCAGAPARRPVVLSVHLRPVDARAVEVAAVVHDGLRIKAVAGRLECSGPAWTLTALEFG